MSEANIEQPRSYALASLSNRFFAALIDGFVIASVMMVFLLVTGMADAIVEFSELSHEEREGHELTSIGFAFKMLALQAAAFIALNLTLLQKYGQTIGKRVMKIAMVDVDGRVPPLHVLLVYRYFSQVVMGLVPLIGGMLRLLDVLLIFRSDRRCLHDFIAKTYVIDVSKPIAQSNNHLVV